MSINPEWSTWAQVIGTGIQIVVLMVLIWQVWVNRSQAVVAKQTLEFARQQYQDSLKQVAQERIDAVLPALSIRQVEHGEGIFIDGDEREHPIPTVTYELENFGRGPAANVAVALWDRDGERRVSVESIQGISPGKQQQAKLWFYNQGNGQLRITYEDIFGTRYQKAFDVYWTGDPSGDIHPGLYDVSE